MTRTSCGSEVFWAGEYNGTVKVRYLEKNDIGS